jgi:molybdate/tungstate transport system permease protein
VASTVEPGIPVRRGVAALGARRVSAVVAIGVGVVVWVALLGPVVTLGAHLSYSATRSSLAAPGALTPLMVSLESAAVSLIVLVIVCSPLAYLLAHDRLPFTRLWETGMLVALMMPPLVIGLLLVFMVGPLTPIGRGLAHVHLSTTNTFFVLVIAQVYEAAPYYVLGAQSAFSTVDPRLEEQAGMLGDPPRRILRRVTLPLAAPGLAMAFAVGWARAMGAFGAVLIVAYHPYGLPMQIWTTLEERGLAAALPFALLLLVVALPLPLAAYAWSARARVRR